MIPLRDTVPSRTYPIVTVAFIAVNVIAFLYELSLGPALDEFTRTYAVVPSETIGLFTSGKVVTAAMPVFTAMFLHGGWWHLIGNMLYLWIFGDNVEDRMGHSRFVVFYLLCGIGSTTAHIISEPSSSIPTLGASGAIAGVLGAYMILFPRSRVVTLVPIFLFIHFIEVPAVIFLGIWFIMQLSSGVYSRVGTGTIGGGIAWWAHIGGFVLGMALLPLFRKR